MRIHIVRRTGDPQGAPAFLGHPWWQNGSDRGIAWGVLESPRIQNVLGVIKGQHAEEAILCPRYLISATREGSHTLSVHPRGPLPLRALIFLHKDDDLRAWLLANDGQHPLDLMVMESCNEEAGAERSTWECVGADSYLFDRNLWDHSGPAEDKVWGIQWDDEDEEYDHIVVSNRRIRQQSGEHGNEMEVIHGDKDDEGAEGTEDYSEEDVAEGELESEMPQERETIVIKVGLLCFSYLEGYQSQ